MKYEKKSDKILYLANLTKKKVAAKASQAKTPQAKLTSISKAVKDPKSDCESLVKLKLDDDVKQ